MNPDLSLTLEFLGNEEALILVPKTPTQIDPKSGICASRLPSGEFQIDYEGNRFGAENLRTYEQRLLHALDRGKTKYPTVARQFQPLASLEENFHIVGIINYGIMRSALQARTTTYHTEEQCVRSAMEIFPEKTDVFESWKAA